MGLTIPRNGVSWECGFEAMSRKKLLGRIRQGSLCNIKFGNLLKLAEGFGFELRRVSGSHHILYHPGISRILSLQPAGSDAKPYQIREFLDIVEEYGLDLEE